MPAERVLHFRHLSHRERQTLASLRTFGTVHTDEAVSLAFAALSREATRANLTVLAPGNLIVHPDERMLLGWLAALQRRKLAEDFADDGILDDQLLLSLRNCAKLLDQDGCHLEYRTVSRAGGADQRRRGTSRIEGRALRLVSEQGAVATQDLKAIGLSSFIIGSMRKAGLLRRVRHGVYSLGQSQAGGTMQAEPAGRT